MRIGIYGGSFSPIHLGHLIVAEMCRDALSLDSVRFLPANVSPFKQDIASLEPKHRLEMVRLAISGNPAFSLDDREIRSGGVSYTIDSLRSIQGEFPDAELFLIVGADSLVNFDKWKSPQEILSLAMPAVVSRGGVGEPPWQWLEPLMSSERLAKAKELRLRCPQIEISSTDIRTRARNGRSIRYLVPSAVAAYIQEHRLFLANEVSQ